MTSAKQSDHGFGSIVAVVDDDQRILESLGSLLESADHSVRLFASAPALLESGCVTEIDFLISDIDMSPMNGFDLLRIVRAARADLPIVLVTGHPELMHRSPHLGLSNVQLFKKPFDGQELLAAISRGLLDRQLRGPEL